MLQEDQSITYDEILQYKHSTRMEMADRILDDLIPAARESGGEKARQAAGVLETWDRCADANSRGALLFQEFVRELSRRSGAAGPFAIKWNEESAMTTPDGLADKAAAVAVLEAVAAKVEKDFGRMDVPWGDVNRLRRAGVDLPANGGPGELGIFRVVGFDKAQDGRFEALGGDSYVAVIEFSNPVRAMTLITYGNSSQPGSPHMTDQLPLFARKELRPVWRTRTEIEKHLEARKVFD
jgi:acyl-homoserine-lactone acylase